MSEVDEPLTLRQFGFHDFFNLGIMFALFAPIYAKLGMPNIAVALVGAGVFSVASARAIETDGVCRRIFKPMGVGSDE